ncbi:threonine--tRNA ligase [Mycoplasma marinum]|uniref:Threonine--tRNA ligase n=1 Tax=Mycoplasma marinum TaxID=1937190 RepID=A0A4R0XMN3_9MOLU|nr:threonine--tRNA ligase [Mycoplasma marinum]TCG11984.1 threonine--tRNA ligase [Mycoplasma marinum]
MKVNKELNHTASHLLAAAVLKLYPETKLGFGPAIEEGFYYDFEFVEPIQESDLKKIEKQMSKMLAGGYKVQRTDAVDLSDQPYKQELINEFTSQGKEITYYGMINPTNKKSLFTDLCAGGHVEKVSEVKHFKLLNLAGAYWRGNSDNIQLTRIYGTAWETKKELEDYLTIRAERAERDHRKIGKEMNLFMFSELAGKGFPIYLPDGQIMKNIIQEYVRKTEKRFGFTEVQTPAFGSKNLYIQSGHWAHYKDDMYEPVSVDGEELVMRPMTCPHHFIILNSQRRSYRDFPLRLSEQSRLYRYEKSGALSGLERVRSMELTEGHIFCREDQIIEEFKNSYNLIKEGLEKFNIEIDYVSLSLRDPKDNEKYHGDEKMWSRAEDDLRKVLKDLGIEYKEMIGEAAFYGPKIDIQVKTALGHEVTLSTLQLDFLLPEKFDAHYWDENENKVRPVLIHRGFLSTYERFIATILEQTKGVLPYWLAPKQVSILPVSNEHHLDYALEVMKELESKGVRVTIDDSKERLGKKMRNAQLSKVKYQFVIGDDEKENKTINVRAYGSKEQETMTIDEFIKKEK